MVKKYSFRCIFKSDNEYRYRREYLYETVCSSFNCYNKVPWYNDGSFGLVPRGRFKTCDHAICCMSNCTDTKECEQCHDYTVEDDNFGHSTKRKMDIDIKDKPVPQNTLHVNDGKRSKLEEINLLSLSIKNMSVHS